MFADSLVLVRGGAGVYAFTDALKLGEVLGPLVQSGSGRRWKSLGFSCLGRSEKARSRALGNTSSLSLSADGSDGCRWFLSISNHLSGQYGVISLLATVSLTDM